MLHVVWNFSWPKICIWRVGASYVQTQRCFICLPNHPGSCRQYGILCKLRSPYCVSAAGDAPLPPTSSPDVFRGHKQAAVYTLQRQSDYHNTEEAANVLAPPILLTLNLILICCCRRWRKELRKRKLLLSAQLLSGTGEHRDKPSNFHIAYVVSGSLQTTACTKAVHSHGVAPTFYAPPLGCCTTDCNICSVFIIPYAIVYCSTISNCTCNEMCRIPSEH